MRRRAAAWVGLLVLVALALPASGGARITPAPGSAISYVGMFGGKNVVGYYSFGNIDIIRGASSGAITSMRLTLVACPAAAVTGTRSVSVPTPLRVGTNGAFTATFSTTIHSYPSSVQLTGAFRASGSVSGTVTVNQTIPLSRGRYCGYRVPFFASTAPILAKADAWSNAKIDHVVGTLVGSYHVPGKTIPEFEPCTATVVDSANQSVIVTAAHCLQTLAGGIRIGQFVFAPDHSGPVCPQLRCGTNPLGLWTAGAANAFFDHSFATDQRYDVGFVRLTPNAAHETVQLATALANGGWTPSLAVSAPSVQAWFSVGYPLVSGTESATNDPACYSPSSPQYLNCQYPARRVYCSSFPAAGAPQPGGPGPQALLLDSCADYTFGASGGPWFDAAGDVGLVNKAANSSQVLGTDIGSVAQRYFLQASG